MVTLLNVTLCDTHNRGQIVKNWGRVQIARASAPNSRIRKFKVATKQERKKWQLFFLNRVRAVKDVDDPDERFSGTRLLCNKWKESIFFCDAMKVFILLLYKNKSLFSIIIIKGHIWRWTKIPLYTHTHRAHILLQKSLLFFFFFFFVWLKTNNFSDPHDKNTHHH